MSKISVFIADDHPLIRQALKLSILTEDDMEVVGEAVDGLEAIKLVPDLNPDIVIMDLMMPNMDGYAATRNLHKHCPRVYILVLSSLNKEEAVFKAVQAGARGYLTKNTQHDELVSAIRIICEGKSYFPSKIRERELVSS
ncbi:MAG: hypothetical protein B5M51_05090 [Anaerolinea sp. 4484_236]|nr:MAG: hypothetical protein B5M51_05090 [Anaerolinea sp. 4484_236]